MKNKTKRQRKQIGLVFLGHIPVGGTDLWFSAVTLTTEVRHSTEILDCKNNKWVTKLFALVHGACVKLSTERIGFCEAFE